MGNAAGTRPTSLSWAGPPRARRSPAPAAPRHLAPRRPPMRIAIYVRVSTQRQAQTQTIDQQIERLRSHVAALGGQLPVGNVFRDDGYSGATLKRPGLDRLRDRAAMAAFDRVVLTDPDRLARNYVHQVL